MKAAFLIEQLDSRRGGMEMAAIEFLNEIVRLMPSRKDLEIHVLTQRAESDFSIAPVHSLGVKGTSRAARYRNFVRAADSFLTKDSWDVVHTYTPCLRCDLYEPLTGVAAEALERTIAVRRTPYLRALRRLGAALSAKQRLWTRLERDLLSSSVPPLVAAISSYMRRQVEQTFKFPPEHLRDVFSGVTVPMLSDSERAAIRERIRRDLGLDLQTPVAIFVGHNFRRKGLARLLEALALPEAGQWHLLVVGKDNVEPVRRLARKLQVLERAQFLGHRTDVWDLYCAADVCVLPTYYDPGSRTILEALSLGVPSITTLYDGSADCIRDGEHGFVLKSPEAIEALAHALQQLVPESVRQRMSQNALKLRPYLSMRRHAEEIAALYEEIARKASARSVFKSASR